MTEEQRAALIVSQCGGIHPPLEVFYILSIVYSAERALAAFDEYDLLNPEPENATAIFGAVQEGLSHAAALSRFFWPPSVKEKHLKGLASARARKLRAAFAMDDSSPLRLRKARDALDHFDERLDRFLLDQASGQFFPFPMFGSFELADWPAKHFFKVIDLEEDKIIILGEVYDFGRIREEVTRVLVLANQYRDDGARLRES